MTAQAHLKPVPYRPERPVTQLVTDAIHELAGSGLIVQHTERQWASVTFAGSRHRLELLFEGSDAVKAGERFIAFLPEHEFDIPGQLIADAAVTEVESQTAPPRLRVACELLLLDERS
jgi:hypothetical protein